MKLWNFKKKSRDEIGLKNVNKILSKNGYEDIIVYNCPTYDTALIGVTNDNRAVYDFDLMVEYLIKYEEMTEEEATDFISYNDSFYYGEKYPLVYINDEVYLEDMSQEEDFEPFPEFKRFN